MLAELGWLTEGPNNQLHPSLCFPDQAAQHGLAASEHTATCPEEVQNPALWEQGKQVGGGCGNGEIISNAALNWSLLFSSQSLEDVGGIRRALQKEHERLCTLVTPVSGWYWGFGAGKNRLSHCFVEVQWGDTSPFLAVVEFCGRKGLSRLQKGGW